MKRLVQNIKIFSLLAISLSVAPLSAHAQETSGNFAEGHIIIGADATACSSSIEGAVRYETDRLEFCDGTSWENIKVISATPCTIGAVVGEGICAGRWGGQNLITTQTGCSWGDTSAASCGDANDVTLEWGENGWNDLDASIIDVVQANADYFAQAVIEGANITATAATMCASLTIDGETWYLPTIGQLALMYENRNTGDWTGGSFTADEYFSVNNRLVNIARTFDFSSGRIEDENNDFSSKSVRCVRLE